MQGISIPDISWLAMPDDPRSTPQESAKQRLLAQDLIRWVFEDYLIPLLRVSSTLQLEWGVRLIR